MKLTLQHIIFSLFIGIGFSSCSKSNNQQSSSDIHTDFIAKNDGDFEKPATVEEIMVQFHGCKAHQ